MAKGDKVSFIATPEMMPVATNIRQIMAAKKFPVREVVPVTIKRFADGVSVAKIEKSVRRTEVYLFYTPPLDKPDLGFAELSKILNAAHFASPRSIKLVLPYFWEGRADRKSEARISTNVKELAKIIERHGTVDGLFTFDLHAEQIVLAFDQVPVDDLKGRILLAQYFADKICVGDKNSFGVVAPDVGSVKRSAKLARRLGIPLKGVLNKERTGDNAVEVERYIGDPVAGLHIYLPDDIIDTAGTILAAAKKIMECGALSVTAWVTHWLGSPKDVPGDPSLFTAEAKFRHAKIKVLALNTIPRTPEYLATNSDFLTMVSCEQMLADAIIASLTPGESVSKLSE